MKAFYFEGFNSSKVFGDRNSPDVGVIVTGAPDKAAAKAFAAANMKGLRIVNAGNAYANPSKAIESAEFNVRLTASLNSKYPEKYPSLFSYSVIEWKA